jgi:hypothetical protein
MQLLTPHLNKCMKGSESIRKEVEVEAGIEVKRKLN